MTGLSCPHFAGSWLTTGGSAVGSAQPRTAVHALIAKATVSMPAPATVTTAPTPQKKPCMYSMARAYSLSGVLVKLLLLALLLASPLPALAAVAFDASGSSTETGQDNSISATITTAGANRILFAGVHTAPNSDTVSSITHNGVAMTTNPLGRICTNVYCVHVFYLVAPATGLQTVTATLSGSTSNKSMTLISFTGAHQVSPLGTCVSFSGTANPMTATITVPTNGMGVSIWTNNEENGTFTPGAGQTEPFADFPDTDLNLQSMVSYTSTTGSVAMTFTNSTGNYGAGVACPINEAAAATAASGFEPIEM